jgi:anti-sigma regulatory factor (Ser/Thr protein kinase)
MTFGHSPAQMQAGDRTGVFELPARDACVREARHRVHAQLGAWELGQDTRDAAALVVSELVTNALIHTSSEVIVCMLREEHGWLRIEVTDQGGAEAGPAPQTAGADQEHGRGLLLVTRLADAWGVVTAGNGGGRSVWVVLRSTED